MYTFVYPRNTFITLAIKYKIFTIITCCRKSLPLSSSSLLLRATLAVTYLLHTNIWLHICYILVTLAVIYLLHPIHYIYLSTRCFKQRIFSMNHHALYYKTCFIKNILSLQHSPYTLIKGSDQPRLLSLSLKNVFLV